MEKKAKNSKEVIESIRVLYGFKNLTQLSEYFGKQRNWASQMINKESIPYPQCVQACIEKGSSLDDIIFHRSELDIDFERIIEGKSTKENDDEFDRLVKRLSKTFKRIDD